MGLFQNLFGSTSSFVEKYPKYFDHDYERQKRLERYKNTWEAYLAELPDPITQDTVSNDNVKVNPARAIINTGVFFLFGSELKFQVSPESQVRYGKQSLPAKPSTEFSAEGTSESAESDDPQKQSKKSDFRKEKEGDDYDPKKAKGSYGAPEGEDPIAAANPKWLTDLNKVWKENRKKSFLFNMGLSGAIHGDVFVKIIPNACGMKNQYPRLLLLDPANVDVEWDPNDCNRVLKYAIEYVVEEENPQTQQPEPKLRIQEITANVQGYGGDPNEPITSWTIQNYEHPMGYVQNVGYTPLEGGKVPVGPAEEWPYAWAPIEHCQNVELPHMYWGLPDLDESSVEVLESLQRSMSSLNKIVRVHASPRMFAKNVMPDQIDEIDVSADNIITLPNMEAELNVLETLSNLAPSIEYAREQRKMLLEMVQCPPIALGEFESASTAISGVTLSILYAPILQKTELKRISYGDMIERLNQKILVLMGHDEEETESMVLVWPESMPGSAYLERQTLQQDQQMGASSYTILSRLGYDPKEERANFMREQEEVAALQAKYMPEPQFGQGGPGGNNNPAGNGNKNGSMGGTKAAGTPKSSPGASPTPKPSK